MKIERLISIIMVLLNCEKISATKLAKIFEVTTRTIYRDIEAIEKAGIPIFTMTGVDGGIGILPEYKVDKNLFTISDIQTLLMGLDSVSNVLSQKELIGTLEKVKNLVPNKSTIKSSQITVDLTAWMGNKSLLLSIELIKQALEENRILSFSYFDKSGKKSLRKVEPYQLILKETHWYLNAYCLERGDFRVFKVIRITNLILEKESFIPKECMPKSLNGEGWIKQKLIPIQLLFHKSLYERMMELCGEDRITYKGEDTFIAEFQFAPDDYGYNILLGFGDKCECIAPSEVRNELSRRIEKLANIYR